MKTIQLSLRNLQQGVNMQDTIFSKCLSKVTSKVLTVQLREVLICKLSKGSC